MQSRTLARWLESSLRIGGRWYRTPLLLYQAALRPTRRWTVLRQRGCGVSLLEGPVWRGAQTRYLATAASGAVAVAQSRASLPLQCPGCGALSQETEPDKAGFYSRSRKAVKAFLGLDKSSSAARGREGKDEDEIVRRSLQSLDPEALSKAGVDVASLLGTREKAPKPPPPTPICDRCHRLVHHNSGESIYHPSIESLRDTIEESPHKHNHVYHVLDAADFPLSLLPRLHRLLDAAPLRSRNRRSRNISGHHTRSGKTIDISFVITRADLLAPTKQQADALLPYLTEVLREALGRTTTRSGKRVRVRLGNVRLVSAMRGWNTVALKEEIWSRGGAVWMVGRVNVGKSQLVEAVFPKGRMSDLAWKKMDPDVRDHDVEVDLFPRGLEEPGDQATSSDAAPDPKDAEDAAWSATVPPSDEPVLRQQQQQQALEQLDETSLLPPPPPEVPYPAMPLVSALPGTTASPIRLPFGGGRGELIDLPGLPRSDLELYVRDRVRSETRSGHESLVMRRRVVPEQLVLKPGQSLVLGGGLIRMTPRYTTRRQKKEDVDGAAKNAAAGAVDRSTVDEEGPQSEVAFMVYPFLPLCAHVTATRKAIALQAQLQVREAETQEANPSAELSSPLDAKASDAAAATETQPEADVAHIGTRAATPATSPEAPPAPGARHKVKAAPSIPTVALPIAAEPGVTRLAGSFPLKYDVTKSRAGPLLTRRRGSDGKRRGLRVDDLPFRVLSTDVLVEGVGWVEVVAQVRAKDHGHLASSRQEGEVDDAWDGPEEKQQQQQQQQQQEEEEEPNWPTIDVYTPEGRFVASRRPMSAWLRNRPRKSAAAKANRPRRSMKGAKKRERAVKRARAEKMAAKAAARNSGGTGTESRVVATA